MQKQLTSLRNELAALEQGAAPRPRPDKMFGLGFAEADRQLGGGLVRAGLHEIFAAHGADASAAAGFGAALAQRAAGASSVFWIRQIYAGVEIGRIYAPGLAELGLCPNRLVMVEIKDALDVLRAGLEAAACTALGGVIVEPWGDPKTLDFTATRRLDMAASQSGVPVFLLRVGAPQHASAARTRWRISSGPSKPLAANAPGLPTFDITLLRQRRGPAGQRWHLEWDHEHQTFCPIHKPAPLSGAVVCVPASQPPAISDPQKRKSA